MSDARPTEKIRLLLADVDGTLVTKEKLLTERARKAVRALHEAKILFAITSGRPPRGMAMLIEPLKMELPIAGFNGGAFANPDLSLIETHHLAPDVAKQTVEQLEKAGLDVWVYTGDDWYVRNTHAPHVDREQKTVQFAPKQIKDFGDEQLKQAVKIVGISDDLDLVKKAESELQQSLGNRASAARSQPYYLDVTHPEANKGTVLTWLSKRYQILPTAIATIGDMPNDVLMFTRSGFSIAMGNAAEDVQNKASAVTDGMEDEGFAKAVERFILDAA